MPSTFPLGLPIMVIFKFKLVTGHKSYIVFIRKHEISSLFIVYIPIPSYLDIGLSLRFFELLIIIGLKLDEGLKNLFILFRILVSQEHWLLKFLNNDSIELFELSIGICFPKFLEPTQLLGCDFPGFLNFLESRL